MHLLAFLGVLVLTGVAFLAPGLPGAEAKASEQFSAADTLTTYGYSNAHENFNPAETIIPAGHNFPAAPYSQPLLHVLLFG